MPNRATAELRLPIHPSNDRQPTARRCLLAVSTDTSA
jgi:hypothetical protein